MPKYIVLPVALLLYFVAMTIYGYYHNDGALPHNFVVILLVELAILVVLFFILRHQHRRRNR